MTSISKEQILRLNCPGFGEESYLTIGKARPLDSYSVIVVNPVSILHLFDRAPEAVKEIDGKLAEGLTAYTTKNDELLQSLEADLKKRIFELVNFLEKGGLLVYYLCRPFLVQGSSLSMDNYYWLESLAPDTPSESNVRHMSAVSHGRIVDPTEHAATSEFASYLQQSGLEWNTIIRTDFLTEGYIVLATAGPRKCIAAHLIAGDTGGRIVFLPSPYSPDFDRSLMECVQIWHERKTEEFGPSEAPAPPPAAAAPAPTPAPAAESAQASPANQFAQPDPAKFLSPKAEDAAPAPAKQPPVMQKANAAAAAASGANTSRTNLPPVTKFTTSRPMPGTTASGAPEEKAKMSADEILESVSSQAEQAAAEPKEPIPFNERATSDIGTAFSKLNSPLPQPSESGGYQVPSAQDLLKELESMSAPSASEGAKPAESAPKDDASKFARPSEPSRAEEAPKPQDAEPAKTSRNLLKEMETAAGAPPPQAAQAAAPPAAKEDKTFFETLSSKGDEKPAGTPPAEAPKAATPPPEPVKAAEPIKTEPPKPAPPQAAKPVNTPFIDSNAQKSGAQFARTEEKKPQFEAPKVDNNNHDTDFRTPEAKDLIKKMEEITKAAPDWCKEYTFPDLEDLKKERGALSEQVRQTQQKIGALEDKIAVLEGLKNALLASEGDQLMSSCTRVFKRLGWTSKPSDKHDSEFVLFADDRADVIARVVRSNAQAKAGDVAELAQAVITFWGEHEIEPKGVLVACTWANRPPSERNEPDYTDALNDFAQKKNLCLMTTMQLLSIYRDLDMGKVSAEEIRRRITDTNGRLTGFSLENTMTRAGA